MARLYKYHFLFWALMGTLPSPAWGQEQSKIVPKFCDEIFVTFERYRDLGQYIKLFTENGKPLPFFSKVQPTEVFDLGKVLKSLSANDAWIDYGTGMGNGLMEAVSQPGAFKGRAIGIDILPVGKSMWEHISRQPDRLGFLQGTPQQLRRNGQLKLAAPDGAMVSTDYYGAATYAKQLDQVVQTALSNTKDGGYYAVAIPVETYSFNGLHSFAGTTIVAKSGRARAHLRIKDRLKNADKSDRDFILFLKSHYAGILGWAEAIEGAEIQAAYSPIYLAGENSVVLVMKKTGKVRVPRLHLDKMGENSPPMRTYSW